MALSNIDVQDLFKEVKLPVSDSEYEKLTKIALETNPAIEDRGDIKPRYIDSEDFFETAVWCLEKALIDAYLLGKKEGEKKALEKCEKDNKRSGESSL